LLFLAAAVSDFYIPAASQSLHKIESSGPLNLTLPQTPKLLPVVNREWCPSACVVSFKLETDQSKLVHKASQAIERYGMDAVVANELHSRKDKILLLVRDVAWLPASISSSPVPSTMGLKSAPVIVSISRQDTEIEKHLCSLLANIHSNFVQQQHKRSQL